MPQIHPPVTHESVIVDGDLVAEPGVEIGPYCCLTGPIWLGKGVKIGPHSVLIGPLRIGEATVIGSHCVLGSPPESRGCSPTGEVIIGKDCIISDHSIITHGTTTKGTMLGDRIYLLSRAHISHDCHLSDGITMAHNTVLGGHVTVHEGATFGIGTTVHQHTTIGAYAMLGMNSVIAKDVPPFALVAGNPASFKRWNTHQFEKFGMNNEPTGDAYVTYLEQFHRDSKRPVIRPRGQ